MNKTKAKNESGQRSMFSLIHFFYVSLPKSQFSSHNMGVVSAVKDYLCASREAEAAPCDSAGSLATPTHTAEIKLITIFFL